MKINTFKHQPQLDGLRSLCIIFTIFNHVPGTPGLINGGVGVDVFFALSGFLITTLLLNEQREGGGISIKAFYIRRFFRIVPLYVLAFGVTALGAWALSRGGDAKKLGELKHAWPWVLTFNRELCPVDQCGATLFGHAWTIGIEEKFYIVFPVLFFVFKGARSLALSLTAVAAVIALTLPNDMLRGYVGIIFGCLSAMWFARYQRGLGTDAMWLVLMGLGYALSTFTHVSQGNLLISFSASWLILSLVQSPHSALSRMLATPVLVWLGKLTYGIYLFHVLAINAVLVPMRKLPAIPAVGWLVTAVLAYAGAVALAHVLYRWVEMPMIKRGKALAAQAKAHGLRQVSPAA